MSKNEIPAWEKLTLTIEEAIKQIESLKENSQYMAREKDHDSVWDEDIVACDMAIKALEKLLPRKRRGLLKRIRTRKPEPENKFDMHELFYDE